MPIPALVKELPPRRVVRPDRSTARPPGREVEALNVLAHVHNYPPYALTGGAFTMHEVLAYGLSIGWQPRVITDSVPDRLDSYEGIPIRRDRNIGRLGRDYRQAEVVITHLDMTRKASELSRKLSRPLVHLVHNANQLRYYGVSRNDAALVVFNSKWIQDLVGWEGPQTVLHPVSPPERYRVEPIGNAVVMVNLSEPKGAPLFYLLAEKNPGIRFIGVKSTYGRQLPAPKLANLEICEPQVDMRNIYSEARVVVMPSERETWGRVAVEAAISGIPSVCSITPGLLEAGVAHRFVEHTDFSAWNKAIRSLIRGPKIWEAASEEALAKSKSIQAMAERELAETAQAIVDAT